MLAVGGGIIAHETHILKSFNNILTSIPLGSFFSDIILGAIVGYITILIIQSSFKLFKIK